MPVSSSDRCERTTQQRLADVHYTRRRIAIDRLDDYGHTVAVGSSLGEVVGPLASKADVKGWAMRTAISLMTMCLLVLTACGEQQAHESLAGAPQRGTAAAAACAAPPCFTAEPAIAFVSNRDHLDVPPTDFTAAEIYVMNPDGTNVRRLTDNLFADVFPVLSPSGKQIVFDSNRLRTADEPANTSDLFLMDQDGGEQTHLTRGSSATWSPDGKYISFHGSASGTTVPIRPDPGAPYPDNRIFVANVDDLLSDPTNKINITNDDAFIDEDPDWSKDGKTIVFTRQDAGELPSHAPFDYKTKDIFVVNPDGTGLARLTDDYPVEERAPSWSPDDSRVAFMCRRGPKGCAYDIFPGDTPDPAVSCTLFEVCVLDTQTLIQVQLTNSGFQHLAAIWSPDGTQIIFHRTPFPWQLWVTHSDGAPFPDGKFEKQITFSPSPIYNGFPNWGMVRVRVTK
jgi:Tol biopolymer transport system component